MILTKVIDYNNQILVGSNTEVIDTIMYPFSIIYMGYFNYITMKYRKTKIVNLLLKSCNNNTSLPEWVQVDKPGRVYIFPQCQTEF